MKEIKFRAWDTVNNRFFQLIETRVAEMTHSEKDGVVYMQYTGLKDKNGKEIYEGDLVKLRNRQTYPFEVYFDERIYGYRLRFNKEMQFDKTTPLDFAKFGEIIGNIYEGLYSGELTPLH